MTLMSNRLISQSVWASSHRQRNKSAWRLLDEHPAPGASAGPLSARSWARRTRRISGPIATMSTTASKRSADPLRSTVGLGARFPGLRPRPSGRRMPLSPMPGR